MSPSNRVARSLPVFSASPPVWDYVELTDDRNSAVRPGPIGPRRGSFNDYFLYIRESSLRIRSLTAADALTAARFAPVAPHGEFWSLGEYGLLSGSSAHVRATGRFVADLRGSGT